MSRAGQKSYHTKATGLAAETAIKHSADNNLKLFGSCFCPFVQRVWIALELKVTLRRESKRACSCFAPRRLGML